MHIRKAPPEGPSQRGRNQMAAKKTTGKSKGLRKAKKLEAAKPLMTVAALKRKV